MRHQQKTPMHDKEAKSQHTTPSEAKTELICIAFLLLPFLTLSFLFVLSIFYSALLRQRLSQRRCPKTSLGQAPVDKAFRALRSRMGECDGAVAGGYPRVGIAGLLALFSLVLCMLAARVHAGAADGVRLFARTSHVKSLACLASLLAGLAYLANPPLLSILNKPTAVCTASLVSLGFAEPVFLLLALAAARLSLPRDHTSQQKDPSAGQTDNGVTSFPHDRINEEAPVTLSKPSKSSYAYSNAATGDDDHSAEELASHAACEYSAARKETAFALLYALPVAAAHAVVVTHWAWLPNSRPLTRALLGWPLRRDVNIATSPIRRICDCPVAPLSCAVTAVFGVAYAIACASIFSRARASAVNWPAMRALTAIQVVLSSQQLLVAPLRAAESLFFLGDSVNAYSLKLAHLSVTAVCFGVFLVLSVAAPLRSLRKAERIVLLTEPGMNAVADKMAVLSSSSKRADTTSGAYYHNEYDVAGGAGNGSKLRSDDILIPDGLRSSGQSARGSGGISSTPSQASGTEAVATPAPAPPAPGNAAADRGDSAASWRRGSSGQASNTKLLGSAGETAV